MALASGARLGPYEMLSALDAGGMGPVYQAHDSKLGRDVAFAWPYGRRTRTRLP
jgi:eukaryotic-like serine/threonine-protein kinase